MKFDLFDAMRQMKSTLGDSSEILVFNHGQGYGVRLGAWRGKEYLRKQFIVSYRELDDSYVEVMNEQFKSSLKELELAISE